VIRDLVVDNSEADSKFKRIRPYPHRTKPYKATPKNIERGVPKELEEVWREYCKCIECLSCLNICPAVEENWDQFIGPNFFLELAKLLMLPSDEAKRDKMSLDEGIYRCTTCAACEEVCPRNIPIPQLVIQRLRASAVERGIVRNPSLRDTFENTFKHFNPWGGSRGKRGDWTKDLRIRSFQNSKDLEILYFVGCTASYDFRCQEIAKSIVRIFDVAGVKFGILGNEEKCCGGPLLTMGEKGLFEMLAEENIQTFEKYGTQRIIVACPHGYDTLVKDYPLGKTKIKIQHYTEFILELIEQGKLNFSKEINRVVTYHDPCFLGRYNKVYGAPRKILETIPGLSFVEMERNKENSFCCGGGGGRIWIEEVPAEERMSMIRAREAIGVDADILVTACPFCLINLEDAIKVTGMEERIRVKDIAELLNAVI